MGAEERLGETVFDRRREPELIGGDSEESTAVRRWGGRICIAPPRRGVGETMVLPLVFLLGWRRACVDCATAVDSAAAGAIL